MPIHAYTPLNLLLLFPPFSAFFLNYTHRPLIRIYITHSHLHTLEISSKLTVAEFQTGFRSSSVTQSGSPPFLVSAEWTSKRQSVRALVFNTKSHQKLTKCSGLKKKRCTNTTQYLLKVSSGASFQFVRIGSVAVSHPGRNKMILSFGLDRLMSSCPCWSEWFLWRRKWE